MMKKTILLPPPRIDCIPINHIVRHSLDVTIPIKKQINLYENIIKEGNKDKLPLIKVAQILQSEENQHYYLLEGTNIYLGALKAAAAAAATTTHNKKPFCLKSQIESYNTIHDYIIKHVQYNQRPSGFNPLKLDKVVKYLKQSHVTPDENYTKLLQIDNTINAKFLTLPISDDVIEILTELCEHLADRLSQFVLPYYIPHIISKSKDQSTIAKKISQMTKNRTITDARFTWPTPGEIKIIINDVAYDEADYKKEKDTCNTNKNIKNTIDYNDDHINNLDQNTTDKKYEANIICPDGEKITKKTIEQSKSILKNIPGNVIIIPKTKTHPAYIIDPKAKRVSKLTDDYNQHIIKLDDIGASSPYMMPQAAEEWLGLSAAAHTTGVSVFDTHISASDIKMTTFANPADLQQFTKKHQNARGVIFFK